MTDDRVGGTEATTPPPTASETRFRSRFPVVSVWVIAAAVALLLLALANAYGFHRDELYFILAGRHPDWGYVDQPPLTPLVSAAAVGLLGLTPFAVRILPAVIAAATIVLTADIARRLGASRIGQVLAALVLAISGWIGAGHLDETATYDIAFWTLGLWLLVPLLDLRESRSGRGLWLAFGLVLGLALENKNLAAALPLTVGASLIVLRRWDVIRSPWPWTAGVVALAIWAPNLAWQATHGFTQLQMAGQIAAEQGGVDGRVKTIVELLALAGPLLFPVSIAGVVWLLRSPDSRPWRPLGLAVLFQLGLMLAVGGKSYYSAGFLPLSIAAGSIPLSGWLEGGRRRMRWSIFWVAAVLSGLTAAVVLLPIVPVKDLAATPIPAIYLESVAQIGWPELAAQVRGVVDGLDPGDRASAVVITANYGQDSALTLLGTGLPPIVSGHNSTWDWGRPPDAAHPIIVVGFSRSGASAYFDGCRDAAKIDNGDGLDTEEQGTPIQVCASVRRPWADVWPELRHVG